MSDRALLHRAWIYTHTNGRLRMASRAERMLWLNTVMAIASAGDGLAMRFGDGAGDDFSGRAEYLASIDATEAELAKLFDRKLLVESEDGSIGIPPRMDLIRRQKRRPTPPARGFIPRVVRGGRSDV